MSEEWRTEIRKLLDRQRELEAQRSELLSSLEQCVGQLSILLPSVGVVHDERQALISAAYAIERVKRNP